MFLTRHVRIPFSGQNLVAKIFGKKSVEERAENAVHGARQFEVNDLVTAKLYELLKKSRKG